jgi:hypothetical protein
MDYTIYKTNAKQQAATPLRGTAGALFHAAPENKVKL